MTDPRQQYRSNATEMVDLADVLQLLQKETNLARRAEIMSNMMEKRYAADPLRYEYQRV